jgi:hypothetical protein
MRPRPARGGRVIAGQRQTFASHRVAGRAFRWNQAEERHQLSRRLEPAHIADFGGKRYRDQERRAAHRLVCLHDRRHGPGRHDSGELFVQATQTLSRILDHIDPFLEDDLLCRVLEFLGREPTPMGQGPVTTSAVDPTMAKQEREQLLAFAAQVVH